MSKKKLIGIIGACIVVVIVVVVIITQHTPVYTLSVSVSPPGGGETSHLSGEYRAGEQITLIATPGSGYQFVRWTGDVDTVANVEAANTTITIDDHYSIIANFFQGQLIRDWYDLHTVSGNLSGNYLLMSNLDSSDSGYNELAGPTANDGKGWQPIGTSNNPFIGGFDGQAYEISDLFIERPDEDNVGLFGSVQQGGFIKDIGVTNASVTGNTVVGTLVGRNEGGSVSDCYSVATMAGEEGVGGLVGYNIHGGNVSDCYSSATISGSRQYIGGLVGANYYATVSNSHYCYDDVLINGENIITVGALFAEDFDEWLANGKLLDVNERLSEEDDYYLISDVSGFQELLAFGQDDSLKFRLVSDLDLATEPDFYIPYLAGKFDGNSHKISNLSFDHELISQVGLFGIVAPTGEITGLGVESVNVTGARSIGGLVGANHGSVSNSYSTGILHNTRQIGGLVGGNGGIVTDCYSVANVTGYELVGGLIGGNEGAVSYSYFNGSVTGHWHVGGLVGTNEGTVSNSYADASVTAVLLVGGVTGRNEYHDSILINCYSRGNVSGDKKVGGLTGENFYGTVDNCYSSSSVTGNSDVGGLMGSNRGTVTDSFWDTQTSGQASSASNAMGRSTTQMKNITTFLEATWDIVEVANPSIRNLAYIWNIVDDETYPFLSWEPVS